jgi:hypothetical protein
MRPDEPALADESPQRAQTTAAPLFHLPQSHPLHLLFRGDVRRFSSQQMIIIIKSDKNTAIGNIDGMSARRSFTTT